MDTKLNIAFYCSSLSWGGLEMNALKRAKWMAERGHSIQMYCVEDSAMHKEAKKAEISTHIIQRNKKSFDLMNSIRVKKLLTEQEIKLIWFADKRDLSLIALVKFLSGKRIKVLFQQSMQMGVNKREFWHTIRFNRIDYWVVPLQYLADQVKAKTKFSKGELHVVHQGMDIEKFNSSIPDKVKAREFFNLKEEDIVVGMIGRIDPAKAQKFVMDVVTELQKDNRDVKLLFVGSKTVGEWEGYYNDIVDEIKTYKDNGQVQLYPFMEEVGYFYSAIDVFVMASKNETYGMVTIESMLAGNKIVGTKAAGTEELLANGTHGYYFEWMKEQTLKDALRQLLENPEEAEGKALKAKSYAQGAFSHIKELDEIERIIGA